MPELLKNHAMMLEKITYATQAAAATQQTTLLAVSKTKPASSIRTLYGAGQRDFGENYLQEALQKQHDLADLGIIWHYIGSVQRNKTKDIAQHFDWVHTVDRVIIAQRLSDQRLEKSPALNVCIQVNIDAEATKSGCMPCDALELAKEIQSYPRLTLRGVMVIPSKAGSDAFARTKALFDEIGAVLDSPDWDTLSMGMSGDFANAIANGATIIRVGSALFGARD